jgi:hypothetical protein
MSKGSRINSTLAPERYSAIELLVRFSSTPKICPLHFAVEWAFRNPQRESEKLFLAIKAAKDKVVRPTVEATPDDGPPDDGPSELEEPVAISSQDLMVETARLFGFDRTGPDLKEAIDRQTVTLVKSGRLHLDGNVLRLRAVGAVP